MTVVVTVRDHPRDATVDQRLEKLPDALSYHVARMVKLLAARLVLPDTFQRGAPAALAERIGVSAVIPGDLIAGEDDDIRSRGICGGSDETYRIAGYLRAVLDVGKL